MKKLLEKLNACQAAKNWAEDKSWKEIYETCHRGDWLLWLFQKVNPNDLRLLTLAKGHCAATVLHLMKDERSKKAVQVAINFGEGIASHEELSAATNAATYAAATYAAATNAATYAAATYAAAAAAAAAADAAPYAAPYAAAATGTENQKLTADICRKYLPIELWNITKDIEL